MLYFIFLGICGFILYSCYALFREWVRGSQRIWWHIVALILLFLLQFLILQNEQKGFKRSMTTTINELYANQESMEKILHQESPAGSAFSELEASKILKNPFVTQVLGADYLLSLYGYLSHLRGTERYLNNAETLTPVSGQALEKILYYSYLLTFQSQLFLNDLIFTEPNTSEKLHGLILQFPQPSLQHLKFQLAMLSTPEHFRKVSGREQISTMLQYYFRPSTILVPSVNAILR